MRTPGPERNSDDRHLIEAGDEAEHERRQNAAADVGENDAEKGASRRGAEQDRRLLDVGAQIVEARRDDAHRIGQHQRGMGEKQRQTRSACRGARQNSAAAPVRR